MNKQTFQKIKKKILKM